MLTAASPTSSSTLFIPLRCDLPHSLFHMVHSVIKYITVSQLKSVLCPSIISFSQEDIPLPFKTKIPSSLWSYWYRWLLLPWIIYSRYPCSSISLLLSPFLFWHLPPLSSLIMFMVLLSFTWAAWPTSCSSWVGSALYTSILCKALYLSSVSAQIIHLPRVCLSLKMFKKFFNCFLILLCTLLPPKTLNRTSTIGSFIPSMILMFLSTFKLPTPWNEAAVFSAVSLCEGLNKHLSHEWMNSVCVKWDAGDQETMKYSLDDPLGSCHLTGMWPKWEEFTTFWWSCTK